MDAKRGEIVDYEVKDSEGTVIDTLPMLVVHVNTQDGGDGATTGIVFHTDATFHSVVIPKDAPPEQNPATAEVQSTEASFDALTPEDRSAFFRDELAKLTPQDRASLLGTDTPTPSPAPAPEPTPAPANPPVPAPEASPTPDTGAGGSLTL